MRFPGFINSAYEMDSVNVDFQRCVNLYLERIESGFGKEHEIAYLRSTPGLTNLLGVGTGPIRCVHADSIGRIFVVSGNQLFCILNDTSFSFAPVIFKIFELDQATTVDASTDKITAIAHGYYTGLKIQVDVTGGTLPAPLVAVTDYWVIVIDADTIKLASTLANAVAGTPINITAANTGLLTLTPQIPGDNSGESLIPTLFTVAEGALDTTTDIITLASHGMYTGLKVQFSTLISSPGSLAFLTDYFIIKIDANTFKIASTIANASAGTAFDITTLSGTWNVTLLGSRGLAGDTAVIFATSTGRVNAASMSFLGDGTDSSTIFVDGTQMMLFTDDGINDGAEFSGFGVLANFGGLGDNAVDTATHIDWSDGYFLVNQGGTNSFFASDLKSFNFNALEFASAEGSPDKLIALIVSYRVLCLFGERTTEVFSDTGNANFPFERMQGGFVEIGTVAPYSVAKSDSGSVFWLGRSENGTGIVYTASGLNPQRISTHAIEQKIASYADPSSATAYVYQSKGHTFYVLNFAEATWCFDLITGSWHERAYTNNGVLERHRADFCVYAPVQKIHLLGDYSSNVIYQFDDSVYTDDGAPITRLRSAPHLSADTNRIYCSKFQLDMETGIGLDGGVQGSAPTVMLDFSDDGGHTFSSESFALADAQSGQIGEYKTRVIWRRLGSFRDRIFRIKITDPVKVVILGANIDVQPGVN